ncbi:MAG: glycosyltransferase family 39 protein [Alphaproteobacteria bacterium]|jgi:4-amino-4-deoxy-L-arabinose transferase-like glycosyltransferase|nr:glycosyltransferase family 39 protein [Alphaproteobacteria bacterium]
MRRAIVPALPWLAAWLLLVGLALGARPLTPVDETRYLAVAWEMWVSGDALVPHLNGEPYSHKPPLLFWLINLGWAVAGVSEWWARLVAPLCGLGALFAARALAAKLWPERPEISELVPWLLLGSLFWAAFASLTMFDMLLTLISTVGLLALVVAWRGRLVTGFAGLALALGLGVLAKGPVIALYLLPPALLAPWWASAQPPAQAVSWRRWYGGLALAVLVAAAAALAWALPAARAGGPAYGDAILWGQTAGRMSQSFAHDRPFWWYLPLLPLLLFPWFFWPPLWRGAWRNRAGMWGETGPRLALATMVPAFVVFSLISGKQPHYMLPLFPPLMLIAARALPQIPEGRWSLLPPALIVLLAGLALVLFGGPGQGPPEGHPGSLPSWLGAAEPLGFAMILLGALVAVWRGPGLAGRVRTLALQTLALVLLVHATLVPALRPAFDLQRAAAHVGEILARGHAVAVVNKYQGQLQFPGRLRRALEVVPGRQLESWLAAHPDGHVVTLHLKNLPQSAGLPLYVQPYRGRQLAIWTRDNVLAEPLAFY